MSGYDSTDEWVRKGWEQRLARLSAERDLYRSLAVRYADMWQPQFPLDPDEGLWVFPWADDVPDEPMTPEQVEFYRQRREARQ